MRLNVESWIWWSLAICITTARLISRILLFGSSRRLQFDDWVMCLFVIATYTTLIVTTNVEPVTHSNLLPPGFSADQLRPEDVARRVRGSKIVVVVEQMQIATIWGCKACLLALYHRLTCMVAAKENLAIKILAGYVALGFVVMELLYFSVWCRPFDNYWAVPVQNPQCSAAINHRITNAVFNMSSDIIMLAIALPMFVRSHLPLKRKLILCGIFSLGIFVVLAAAINKYYSFTAPYSLNWIFWYIRESSTAILVANLPFTWTLLRRLFNLGAWDPNLPPPVQYHSARTASGRRAQRTTYVNGQAVISSQVSKSRGSKGGGSGIGTSHTTSAISQTSHLSKEGKRTQLASWDDPGFNGNRENALEMREIDLEAQRHTQPQHEIGGSGDSDRMYVAPAALSPTVADKRGARGGGRSANARKMRSVNR